MYPEREPDMQETSDGQGLINNERIIPPAKPKGSGFPLFRFTLLIMVLGFFLTGGYIVYRVLPPPEPLFTLPTSTTIVTRVQNMGRLETVSYTLEKVIAYDPDANSWLHFLGDHKKLFVVYGEVVAGFDLTKITKNDVKIQGKENKTASITLNMPAPQILSANIDPHKTTVYDANSGVYGLWNESLDSNTTLQIIAMAQKSLRTEACQEGILQSASNSGRPLLTSFLSTVGYPNVTVNIPTGDCS